MTVASDTRAASMLRRSGTRYLRRLLGWAQAASGVIALVAAGVPMLLAGAVIAVQRPDALLDGDQAIDELALMRSTHFAQLVGNYSRYGWNHPGPAWFYALDPFYVPLGGHSWSYYVAVLGLHAVVAGLVAAAAWRTGGRLLALVVSGLLLLYVRGLGESVFRTIWPPFAPILPMILFFVLAASGAAGSMPAVVGALIAGSFVVQVHVSTVPLVLSVLATMAAVRVGAILLTWRATGSPGPQPALRPLSVVLTAAGALVLILMWVPVTIDEMTGRPGNATKLWWFFTSQHGRHPYHEAVSIFGRLVEVYPFGRLPDFLQSDFSNVPADRWLAIGLFLAAAASLAALATLLRDRFAQTLALALLVAVPVTIIAISRIVGPMYPYLLIWVTTYPLLLLLGWTALVVRARASGRWDGDAPRAALSGLLVVLCIGLIALAAGRFTAFQELAPVATEQFDPGTRAAWALTAAALAHEPASSVRLDIASGDQWPLAAGLALQLEKHGWKVTVNGDYVFLFGNNARATGREGIELILVAPTDVQRVDGQLPGLQTIGHTQNTYLLLRHLPPGNHEPSRS